MTMKTNSNNLLLKQEDDAKKLEPIYSTYFDVEFTSVDLTEEDKQILHDCIVGVSEREITFGVFYEEDTKKIVPIDSILKLKSSEKKSDIIIYILDKDGKTIGNLIYKECNVEVDFSDFLYFKHHDGSFLGLMHGAKKEIKVHLRPSAILYNNQEI